MNTGERLLPERFGLCAVGVKRDGAEFLCGFTRAASLYGWCALPRSSDWLTDCPKGGFAQAPKGVLVQYFCR